MLSLDVQCTDVSFDLMKPVYHSRQLASIPILVGFVELLLIVLFHGLKTVFDLLKVQGVVSHLQFSVNVRTR